MDSIRGCSVDGCDRQHEGRGFCRAHYKRWRKSGDPGEALPAVDYMPLPRLGDMSRPSSVRAFWAQVDTSGACWEWTGTKVEKGYGITSLRCLDGSLITTSAHRRAWRALVGEIEDDLTLDHLCRNTGCVNPDHMEPVTRIENYRRATFPTEVCTNGHEYTERDTLPAKSSPTKHTKRCRQCLLVRAHRKVGLDCSYERFCSAPSHLTRDRHRDVCSKGHSMHDAYIRPDNGGRQCRGCITARRARSSAAGLR